MKVSTLLLSLLFAGITTLTRAAAVEEHSAGHLRASAHAVVSKEEEEEANRLLLVGCPVDPTYGCANIHTYVNVFFCTLVCVPQDQLNSPDYVNYECGGCEDSTTPPLVNVPGPAPAPAPGPSLTSCPVDPTYGCVDIHTSHISGECTSVCVTEDRVSNPEYAGYECGVCPESTTPPLSGPETCPTDPTTGYVCLHYFVNNDTECQVVCVPPDQVGNPFYAGYECGGCSESTTPPLGEPEPTTPPLGEPEPTTPPLGEPEPTTPPLTPPLSTCPTDPTYGCVNIHTFVNSVCSLVCVPQDEVNNNPQYVNYECGGCSSFTTQEAVAAEQQGSSAMFAGYVFSGLSMIAVSTVLAFS